MYSIYFFLDGTWWQLSRCAKQGKPVNCVNEACEKRVLVLLSLDTSVFLEICLNQLSSAMGLSEVESQPGKIA